MRAAVIRPGPGSRDDVQRVQLTDRPLDPWTLELRFTDGVPVGLEFVLPRGAQPVELEPALLARLQAHWDTYLGLARHVLEGETGAAIVVPIGHSEATQPGDVTATVGRGRATASGRTGTDDGFYARVAAEYRQHVAAGRRPGKELAATYDASRSTVSNWLAEARRRGLLESPGHGRTGG